MGFSLSWHDRLIEKSNTLHTNAVSSNDFLQINAENVSGSINATNLALWLTLFSPEMLTDLSSVLTNINNIDLGSVNVAKGNTFDELAYWNDYQEYLNNWITELNRLDLFEFFDQFINQLNIKFLGLNQAFFESYVNIFDEVIISLSSSFNAFFTNIDLTFLDEVNEVLTDFQITNYINILFEASSPDPKQLDDLSILFQNLDELHALSNFIERRLRQGTARNDIIEGSSGNNIILGLAGNDVMRGRQGDDLINGGAGHDTILGQRGKDLIFGNDGRDEIRGGIDNDTIAGGNGRDKLIGGRGSDIYILESHSGLDKIFGFTINKDIIQISDNFEIQDLEVVDRRGSALIRFAHGSGHKGRFALINNMSSSQFPIVDTIRLGDSTLSNALVL